MACEDGANEIEVVLQLASGQAFSVFVRDAQKICDVRRSAEKQLDCKGCLLSISKDANMLQDNDLAVAHLPGPWQVVKRLDRVELICEAILAEEQGCYDDMWSHMKAVVQLEDESVFITMDECKLLRTACTSCIGRLRTGWKDIQSNERAEDEEKARISRKIREFCCDVSALLSEHALPRSSGYKQAFIFCLSMLADIRGHLAEVAVGDERRLAVKSACASYEEAMREAVAKLPYTAHLRLQIICNYSEFLHEYGDNQARAFEMARCAFEDAHSRMRIRGFKDEEDYRMATIVMQRIRDNLTLWDDRAVNPG